MADEQQRRTIIAAATACTAGVGMGAVGTMLVQSMRPTTYTRERHIHVVDISKLKSGDQHLDFHERAGPTLFLRRTPEQLKQLNEKNDFLLDPHSDASEQPEAAKNAYRSLKPELLVITALCTHLGCMPAYFPDGKVSPMFGAEWKEGFICPCHGATFDSAGRVYKNKPAPKNMRIPFHRYLNENEIEIGIDDQGRMPATHNHG